MQPSNGIISFHGQNANACYSLSDISHKSIHIQNEDKTEPKDFETQTNKPVN